MNLIYSNLQAVQQRINNACAACGRSPDEISLLAVSKTWPATAVLQAIEVGQRRFGENYVQESVDKIQQIRGLLAPELFGEIEWHFIGPLQSNKTRVVAEIFDWVHSVDRWRIAERLSEQRPEHQPPLSICIQVNVSQESSKSGVALDEAAAFCRKVALLPRLRLRGLMAIPAPLGEGQDEAAWKEVSFRPLRLLREQLEQDGMVLDTLSMGMSHDLEAAIAEGSTMVRIGTAIFGERNYS